MMSQPNYIEVLLLAVVKIVVADVVAVAVFVIVVVALIVVADHTIFKVVVVINECCSEAHRGCC